MGSLKEIKGRIGTVKNTRKITSAMKMVASAKLHKAQDAIENMLPYQERMNHILLNFLGASDVALQSPYVRESPVRRVAIVVFSSNSSLCGAFNANVLKHFERVADEYKSLGNENIWVYPVGKKIEEVVEKMGYPVRGSYQEMAEKPSYQPAFELAEELMQLFVKEEIDKIEVVYHHFRSSGSQQLLQTQFLPINLSNIQSEMEEEKQATPEVKGYRLNYIVEPSEEEFIKNILPEVLKLKLFTALLDSAASEHATRMMAMQVATDNANELIDDLTKLYNRSRQQTITNELLDIIGGSMK